MPRLSPRRLKDLKGGFRKRKRTKARGTLGWSGRSTSGMHQHLARAHRSSLAAVAAKEAKAGV